MKRIDIWFVVGVLLVLLGILMSIGVVFGATCDRWMPDSDIVSGLDSVTISDARPEACYNCMGTGNAEILVSSESSGYKGYYWNGSAWVEDSSLTNGLPTADLYYALLLCYNCTGTGYWELIANYVFEATGYTEGYYWNGSAWVEDSSIANGLPKMAKIIGFTTCYNCTGTGYRELIIGYSGGIFGGYYWNGTSWVEDSSIVNNLPDVGAYAAPELCYNCTGTGHWELIVGRDTGDFLGYYWNGSAWVEDSSIVTALEDVGDDSNPALCDNCTGTGYLELLAANSNGVHYGYKFVDTYDGIHITQEASASKSEVGIGNDNTITAKAWSLCGLKYANISIYHSETGEWVENDGTFSQASLNYNDDEEHEISFTGHPAVAYCDHDLEVKITIYDYGDAVAETTTSYKYVPYIEASGDTSIIPSGVLMDEVNGCNATISASGSGSTWFRARMGFVYRNETFRECPYDATNAEYIKSYNTTEYCVVNVTTESLSAGDIIRVYRTEKYRAFPPPNLPAAIASAGLVIIVIYTIVTRKRS